MYPAASYVKKFGRITGSHGKRMIMRVLRMSALRWLASIGWVRYLVKRALRRYPDLWVRVTFLQRQAFTDPDSIRQADRRVLVGDLSEPASEIFLQLQQGVAQYNNGQRR